MYTFLFKRREHVYLVVERTLTRGLRVLHDQHGGGEPFDSWCLPVETLSEVRHEQGVVQVVDMPD